MLEPTYEVIQAADAQEGLDLFHKEAPHLLLLDVLLPGTDGLAVLQILRGEQNPTPVIMLTGTKSVKTAVDSMKLGAARIISQKPFDVDELRIIVDRALNSQELEREVKQLRAQVTQRYACHNLIRKSRSMQEIYGKIEQVADSRTSVLIMGESGTGKELVAKALHYNSGRRDRPFIALNCAALPETLISELFGHEKGSFTDATARRVGQFELAKLRYPVPRRNWGSQRYDSGQTAESSSRAGIHTHRRGHTIKVDVRIVAARQKSRRVGPQRTVSGRSLLSNQRHRAPPSSAPRTRKISPCSRNISCPSGLKKRSRPSQEFSKDAVELLSHYSWPGNVREMENIIEQAFIWSKGSDHVTPEHLPTVLHNDTRFSSLREDTLAGRLSLEKAVLEFEREIILDALKKHNSVQTHAASQLGISRRMLKYRMDTLGIGRPDNEPAPAEPESLLRE